MHATRESAPPEKAPATAQTPLLSLTRADELIGAACLATIVLAITYGVLTRYLFAQPAAWSFEVALIAFVWMVFFGAAAGVRLQRHMAVDALVLHLPLAWQRRVAMANWLLLLLLMGSLALLFVIQAISSHAITTVALSLPRSVVYAPLAVASATMFWQHARLHPWRASASFRAG